MYNQDLPKIVFEEMSLASDRINARMSNADFSQEFSLNALKEARNGLEDTTLIFHLKNVYSYVNNQNGEMDRALVKEAKNAIDNGFALVAQKLLSIYLKSKSN